MPEEKNDKVYVLVQQGGSSYEHYLHAWNTQDEAEQDRIDCTRDGGYLTTPVMEIPRSLAEHPDFYSVVEDILSSLRDLDCVDVEED